jgi:hypothetical protein
MLLLLLLLMSLPGGSAGPPPLALPGLGKWLSALHVHLPPLKVALLGDTATMSQIDCHTLVLGALHSERLPAAAHAMQVEASEMGARCSMGWSASQLGILKEEGTVELELVDSSVRALLQLHGNRSASVSNCSTAIRFGQLRWKGFAGKLLNRLNRTVEASLSTLVDGALCTLLRQDLSANISAAMQATGSVLAPLLALGRQPPPLSPPLPLLPSKHSYVDLAASIWLGMLDFVLDDLVGVDGRAGFDKLIDALTHGSGVLELLPASATHATTLHFNSSGLASVSLALQSLQLRGFDSVRQFDLLQPLPGAAGRHSQVLRSRAAAATLAATMRLELRLALSNTTSSTGVRVEGPDLAQRLSLEGSLKNCSIDTGVQVRTIRCTCIALCVLLNAAFGLARRDRVPSSGWMPAHSGISVVVSSWRAAALGRLLLRCV